MNSRIQTLNRRCRDLNLPSLAVLVRIRIDQSGFDHPGGSRCRTVFRIKEPDLRACLRETSTVDLNCTI